MRGLLLINLGTPDGPDTPSVRRYLAEFLADPRVLDIHPVARWLLLHGVILRTRPARSAHAYQQVWTAEGSPLLVHGRALRDALQARLGQGFRVALGMRYGRPSIASALAELQGQGCDEVLVLPLYPQYSSAATASALDALFLAAARAPAWPHLSLRIEFHAEPGFIDAVATVAEEELAGFQPDAWLFSYHGLPERQVRASELPGPDGTLAGHCLGAPTCCDAITPANRQCYRAQCYATTRALIQRLGLDPARCHVAFQSRLGRTPWIRPYTDEVLGELARAGVRRLAVLTPSFTADCLETVEEIGIRARADFLAAGGEELRRVSCVNAHPRWVEALAGWAEGWSRGLPDAAEARLR